MSAKNKFCPDIYLFGDNLQVHNFLQFVKRGQSYQTTKSVSEFGGVKRMASILTKVFKQGHMRSNVKAFFIKKTDSDLYYQYEPFETDKSKFKDKNDVKDFVWRIRTDLGKESKPDDEKENSFFTWKYNPGKDRLIKSRIRLTRSRKPYYVVFDDHNLTQMSSDRIKQGHHFYEYFRNALQDERCDHFFLKTTLNYSKHGLFDWFTNDEKLSKTIGEKTTIVLDSNILQKRNISINGNVSWDHVVDSIYNELKKGFISQYFKSIYRIVIYFKTAGFLVVYPMSFFQKIKETGSATDPDCLNLYYDRQYLYGQWNPTTQGTMHGDLEILTIMLILGRFQKYASVENLYLTLESALNVIREHFLRGKGSFNKFDPEPYGKFDIDVKSMDRLVKTITNEPVFTNLMGAGHCSGLESKDNKLNLSCLITNNNSCKFYRPCPQTAHHHLDGSRYSESNILNNNMGAGYENVIAKGMQIIEHGFYSELLGVPYAKYGNYITFDKEEICHVNTINTLVRNYVESSSKSQTPLSIAVFGSPGSGKSFIIKQLVKDLGNQFEIKEYNLSQIKDTKELENIFVHISNPINKDKVPIVFWDEFESSNGNFGSSSFSMGKHM